jgi:glycosyltransferase involved in cell wall biosynthesis
MTMSRVSQSPLVTIFLHNLSIGGAERVMLQVARGYAEAGVKVDLVLAQKKGELLPEVPPGARVVDLGANNMLESFLAFANYLKEEKPQVVLSTFEVTSFIALLARKLTRSTARIIVRISVAISRHKRAFHKKIIERYAISLLYPWADGIIAVSQGVADDLVAHAGIGMDRIKVIYNPVVSDQLLADAHGNVDHPFFAQDQIPVVLGVGRLTEQKDFNTLIDAFSIVNKKRPVRLIILGEGVERPSLENSIQMLGLKDVAELPGMVINPFTYMRRASVFVLSSRWEGLPGTLIQALACGCPVVSTDCVSGPSEILMGGKYGHLVPVGDPAAMADAIEDILDGKARKPPPDWLEQFTVRSAFGSYKNVIGV